MIIDNLIPKDYYLVNSNSVLPVELIKRFYSKSLQTNSIYIFQNDFFEKFIMLTVGFYKVSIQDFDSKNDLIDYVTWLVEDSLI